MTSIATLPAYDDVTERFSAAIASLPKAAPSKGIVFHNRGLIDLDAVTTLGVSVKDGDSPIGYFGTGLKFAIATILRNGGTFSLWRGHDEHVFGIQPGSVRGTDFDFVTMDGQKLGFTTQLGRNWEPWMAFRELASNCRDEAGSYFEAGSRFWQPEDGYTTIVVGGPAIMGVWPDRGSILLESEPLFANEHFEIHPGHGAFIYYRGVRISIPNQNTSVRYNIRSQIELTEDRTARWDHEVQFAIERGIAAMDDTVMLRQVLNCGDSRYEHHIDPTRWAPGQAFREVAQSLAMGADSNPNANPAAVRAARTLALKNLQPSQSAALEPHQSKMLGRAKAMLAAAAFDVDAFPVIVVETLGANIHGMAEDGKIFLSKLPFQKGTREVAATLLEEYAHLRSGQSDCTRGFQNWLFDQLLVQAERQAGEPF